MNLMRIARWIFVMLFLFVALSSAEDSGQLLMVDHYVRVKSTVPVCCVSGIKNKEDHVEPLPR